MGAREVKRELALFAGAGGGILGGELLGWRCVCAVEYNPHAASILVARQNDGTLRPFPIWDDIRTFDGRRFRGRVDVVSGGFPCQKFSTATRGRPTADDLWPEQLRVVADVAPGEVFAENVAKKAIDRAAQDLEPLGYTTHCIALSAADVGADHERERYWLRAHADVYCELCSAQHAEVGLLPGVRPRVWETFPDESRISDGVADWMDRLRATGNGQVPAVAAVAWRLLGGR
jgi:DNA (cytosine-5)-methyltransferase 1